MRGSADIECSKHDETKKKIVVMKMYAIYYMYIFKCNKSTQNLYCCKSVANIKSLLCKSLMDFYLNYLLYCFGSRGSQVRILVPRQVKNQGVIY